MRSLHLIATVVVVAFSLVESTSVDDKLSGDLHRHVRDGGLLGGLLGGGEDGGLLGGLLGGGEDGGLLGGLLGGGGKDGGGLLGGLLGGENSPLSSATNLVSGLQKNINDVSKGLQNEVQKNVDGVKEVSDQVKKTATDASSHGGDNTSQKLYDTFRKYPLDSLCPVCKKLPDTNNVEACQKYCNDNGYQPENAR